MKKNLFFIILLSFVLFNSSIVSSDCYPSYSCGEWGNCNDEGIQQRACIDNKCSLPEIIERKFCKEEKGCIPDVRCTKWSQCNYAEKLNDFISKDIVFIGYKERTCTDLNKCIASNIEKSSCSLSIPIDVKKITWCNESYLEIFDKDTDRLVSRIKSSQASKAISSGGEFDISFLTTDFKGYCNYCFNGILDYDEEGVDCGGNSCPSCIKHSSVIDWVKMASVFLWIFFGVFFIMIIKYGSGGGIFSRFFGSIKEASDLSTPSIEREKKIEEKISGLFRRKYI